MNIYPKVTDIPENTITQLLELLIFRVKCKCILYSINNIISDIYYSKNIN